jgi:hypothetical protein
MLLVMMIRSRLMAVAAIATSAKLGPVALGPVAVQQYPGNMRCLEIKLQDSATVDVADRFPPIRLVAGLAGRPSRKSLVIPS